jgi:hypothetical protein
MFDESNYAVPGSGDIYPSTACRERLEPLLKTAVASMVLYEDRDTMQWVMDPQRGDVVKEKGLFDHSVVNERFARMYFEGCESGDYVFKFNGTDYHLDTMYLNESSFVVSTQQKFGGDAREKESFMTIPSEVSSDCAAMESVIFWLYTGTLMVVKGITKEDCVFPESRGFSGDLLEVYKIAKFLGIGELTDLLVRDAVDIFGVDSNRIDAIRQLGFLLFKTQGQVGDVVDYSELFEKVCEVVIDRHAGLVVLFSHPFAFKRGTWEQLFYRDQKRLSLWGEVVDIFFLMFEVPEDEQDRAVKILVQRTIGKVLSKGTQHAALPLSKICGMLPGFNQVVDGVDLGLCFPQTKAMIALGQFPVVMPFKLLCKWRCMHSVLCLRVASYYNEFRGIETCGWMSSMIEKICDARWCNMSLRTFEAICSGARPKHGGMEMPVLYKTVLTLWRGFACSLITSKNPKP